MHKGWLQVIAVAVAALWAADAAADNPPLDCGAPRSPPGVGHFGVGRASIAASGSLAAARQAASEASQLDFASRLCGSGCGCDALIAASLPYAFGHSGDEVCHMTTAYLDAIRPLLEARAPRVAESALDAALAEAWGKGPARIGATLVAVGAAGFGSEWMRSRAAAWLSGRGEIVKGDGCAGVPSGADAALCLRIADPAGAASSRGLVVEAACASGRCARASATASLDLCALQSATGAPVCPAAGVADGDRCKPLGGTPPCSRTPMGGRGVWASALAQGTDEAAALRARDEALRRVIAPIVGVSAAGGRDDALEARLRQTRIQDFSEFRCVAASGKIRVDVFVGESERERLVRLRDNAALAVLVCSGEPAAASACEGHLRDRVRKLAKDAGLDVASVVERSADLDAAEIARLAAAERAATVVVVRLSTRYVGVHGPYHHCRAQPAATLFAAAGGGPAKGIKEARPGGYGADGGFKGLVYTDKPNRPMDACRQAIKTALEELGRDVAGWRQP